ncbi:MAG: flavin reductase family protein, partial [Chloroflexota bacterium]
VVSMKDNTMSVDLQTFKQALSRWASGVTIVTTRALDGSLKGMTASSFTSISLEPPLILISVAKKLYTHEVLTASRIFAVNILSSDQVEWAKLFAGMYPDIEDRFAKTGYTTAETGSPILPGVLGWVDCEVYDTFEAGDHTLFLGRAVAASGSGSGDPLVYANRTWGRHISLD